MAIQRPDPLRELMELQERMNNLFEEVLGRTFGGGAAGAADSPGWKPRVDLLELERKYVLRADLPGMSSEDFRLQVENGALVLAGERRMDPGYARDSYLRVERPYGSFTLQIALPPSVERRGIRARHQNGVLEITLPKKEEGATGKIDIKVT